MGCLPVGPTTDRPSWVGHKVRLMTHQCRQPLHAEHLLNCRGIVADMGRVDVEVGRDWHVGRGGTAGC